MMNDRKSLQSAPKQRQQRTYSALYPLPTKCSLHYDSYVTEKSDIDNLHGVRSESVDAFAGRQVTVREIVGVKLYSP